MRPPVIAPWLLAPCETKDHREAADLLKGAGLAQVESALGLAWETKP